MRVLHKSDEVKAAIRSTFKNAARRRVAIVAFVGKDALDYLPHPQGLELYCWPQPGSTVASSIRGLIKHEVKVHFADRVHMKVYWSSGGKAVVGSANLSTNSLGVGGLHEVAVEIPSSKVDIDALIKRIEAKPATEAAIARLAKADKSRKGRGGGGRRPPSGATFLEWWKSGRRKSWKWGYWDVRGDPFSKRAKSAVREIASGRKPEEVAYCNRGQYKQEDWILRVKLSSTGLMSGPEWVYAHAVVLVEKGDRAYEEANPFQAVQAFPLRQCPEPPFRIDTKFGQAVKDAARDYGLEKTEGQVDGRRPTAGFLKLLRRHYK